MNIDLTSLNIKIMHLHMNGTEVSIKTKSSPVCFVFLKIKLKACPNIVSLNGFELKSHFESDNRRQIMQLPSVQTRVYQHDV